MKNITGACIVDLDLDRTAEGLRQHLQDVQAALNAIERIRVWATPQAIAGVQTVTDLGGTTDPTGVHSGNSLWATAFAILQNAGRPMRTPELAEIMRNSGVVTKSADFDNTLNSAMAKHQSLFLRISPNLWGLLEWNEAINHHADECSRRTAIAPGTAAGSRKGR